MNGVHDMGGMTCFGPVVREKNEPLFHAPWERRVFAMTMLGMGRLDTLDAFRHAIERMDPAHYLESSYYEHWLAALETLALEQGVLTPGEIASGRTSTKGKSDQPPLPPEAVPVVVNGGAPTSRKTGRQKPRFKVGDRVTTKNLNPSGHTRLPRYVRGREGTIHIVHGTFVYPDTNAHGQGEKPQPLYCVRFEARGLWGPDAARRDHLYIDLWEDYLIPVASPQPTAKKQIMIKAAKSGAVQKATPVRKAAMKSAKHKSSRS
ncbi:MAG: nitrile hydratase subunit beta [Deltaproteobacteria bacterium]|nr:nitrile hydratase subunit beta [Deltaproteobacteria bacterium]